MDWSWKQRIMQLSLNLCSKCCTFKRCDAVICRIWRIRKCQETRPVVNQAPRVFPFLNVFPCCAQPCTDMYMICGAPRLCSKHVTCKMVYSITHYYTSIITHTDALSTRLPGLLHRARVTLSVTLWVRWWWHGQSQHSYLQGAPADHTRRHKHSRAFLMGAESHITGNNTVNK